MESKPVDTVAEWTDEGAVRRDYDEVFQMGFRTGWKAAIIAVQQARVSGPQSAAEVNQ